MNGPHPSHVTRMSDASTFDEICVNCGATDQVPGGWGLLAAPCQNPPRERCQVFRPDHNAECLNCDEWADAHDAEAILAGEQLAKAMSHPEKTRAPWADDQVVALNRWQQAGTVHPFTCGTPTCRSILVATLAGWTCPHCPYTQDWAHAYMLHEPPGLGPLIPRS